MGEPLLEQAGFGEALRVAKHLLQLPVVETVRGAVVVGDAAPVGLELKQPLARRVEQAPPQPRRGAGEQLAPRGGPWRWNIDGGTWQLGARRPACARAVISLAASFSDGRRKPSVLRR